MSHITMLFPAVLLACLAPCLAATPAMDEARKGLEADLAAIRQTGEPASLPDLQRPSVPDPANGALDLLTAAKAIDSDSDTMRMFDEINITGPLTAQQQQIVRTLVSENTEVLDLVDAAITKGRFDWQTKLQSPVVNTPLPYLAHTRSVATIVQAAAIAAQIEGDDDLALRRVQQLLLLSSTVDQQPFLISHLVSVGIANLGLDACTTVAPGLNTNAGTAARSHAESLITELLDETNARHGLVYPLQAERIMQADTALAIADGTLSVAELTRLVPNRQPIPQDQETAARIALEDARSTMDYTTQWIRAAGALDWPTAKAQFPAKPAPKPDRYFARLMLSPFERVIERNYAFLASRRMAAVALAARCYALDHAGKLPASLADLAPKYLPAVPTDPFTTGQPIRYLPEQGVIYSIGSDMKDDGGKDKPKSRQPDLVVRLRP